jgi:hypothetical protein
MHCNARLRTRLQPRILLAHLSWLAMFSQATARQLARLAASLAHVSGRRQDMALISASCARYLAGQRQQQQQQQQQLVVG